MAHFAELDTNNVVLRVIVISNEMILDPEGQESEAIGIDFCRSLYGADTQWVKTSYNGNFRKNYAGVGWSYDVIRDAYIPPRPEGDNWILDEETCQWVDSRTIGINTMIGVSRV
jgi:hypothetical protein